MRFAIEVVRLAERLPKSCVGYTIAGQLARCGTSVGANYRAACCARSHADFIAKMGIVHEECDESLYWMELLVSAGQAEQAALESLMKEGRAILAIVIASLKTARSRQ